MSKTAKIVLGIVIIVIIVLVAVSGGKKADAGPIKIGVIAPITGNLAFLGEGIKNAAMMAQDELNSRAGINQKYEVIVEDDAFDVKKTASAALKLINIDKVSAIVTIASAAGNVANPIAEQNKTIHFGIASDPNVAKGDYNFIHWTPPYEETKVFVPELQKRGFKNVAIFGAKIQGVTAVIDSFKNDIKGTDIKIANEQIFDFGTKDFRTMISKAQATKPDIYMLEAFSPELDIIVKQLKEMGIKTPITSIESFEQSDHPENYEGDWYVNAADTTGAFNTAYSTKFSKAPSLGAGNTYDIVKLIAVAAEKAGSGETNRIAKALYDVKIENGALGDLSIDKDGFVISKAVVRMIKNGKPVTISN